MGDTFDMPSLSSYDKGKRAFHGRSYAKDIEAGVEFQDRMWHPVKSRKKKMPIRIQIVGNHEFRIEKALDLSPELSETIGMKDFQFSDYSDEIVSYDGIYPGEITLDGISYGHYFTSGVKGLPISGEHSAYSLLAKRFCSSTGAHSHTLDYTIRENGLGRWIQGLVAGCFLDYECPWAGGSSRGWWSGVVIKRGVSEGQYSPQFISIQELQKEYG